ncbi:putative solute-binding protein [Acinetobacter ihumii]|uniref:putative solute-binding protein n=1 Tax=Acinetobacter ihumii TaxID=2483802 RepID=UPI001030ECF4|nr:putative solute-binding protein [Acinetobacter ihumii]
MKKGLLALGALVSFSFATATQAKINVCAFDLLGKSGESYKMLEEWALAAKTWNAEINLIPRQDEAQAEKDFREGKCDGVYITSMRARPYNKFAGSVDALGAVPNNSIAQKAITFVLDKRNNHRLSTTIDGDKYEVAGIVQIGQAYLFVRDRNINNLERAKGKKIAILQYDEAQKIMSQRVGAVPVASDLSNFVTRFNNGQVDIVPVPAYAYKPLEIQKGLGTKGAMINFPVANITADLIIRSSKFPSGFGQTSRQWFLNQLPKNFAMVRRLEAGIPEKLKINLSAEESIQYQKLLRDGRIDLAKQGIYDANMMTVLKRARCTVERTNFECSLGGE